MSVVLCLILLRILAHTQASPKDIVLKGEIKNILDAHIKRLDDIEKYSTDINGQDTNSNELNLKIETKHGLNDDITQTDDSPKIIRPIETLTKINVPEIKIQYLHHDKNHIDDIQRVTGNVTEDKLKKLNVDGNGKKIDYIQKILTPITNTNLTELKQSNFDVIESTDNSKRRTTAISTANLIDVKQDKINEIPSTSKLNVSEYQLKDERGKKVDHIDKVTTNQKVISETNEIENKQNNFYDHINQARFNKKVKSLLETSKANMKENQQIYLDVYRKQAGNIFKAITSTGISERNGAEKKPNKFHVSRNQTYINKKVKTSLVTTKPNMKEMQQIYLDVYRKPANNVNKLTTSAITSERKATKNKQNNFYVYRNQTRFNKKVKSAVVTTKANMKEMQQIYLDVYRNQGDFTENANTPLVITKLNMKELNNTIVDGNQVENAQNITTSTVTINRQNSFNVVKREIDDVEKITITKTNVTEIKENNIDVTVNNIADAQYTSSETQHFQGAISNLTKDTPTFGERLKFTDFLQNLIEVIQTFEDSELGNLPNIFNKEIKRCNHDNCTFDELFNNFENRNYITHKMSSLVNIPATQLRQKLAEFQKQIKSERSESSTRFIIDYINDITYKNSQDEFKTVLNNFKALSSETNRSASAFENLIKEEMRIILFDHYSSLDRKIQLGLGKLLNAYVRPMEQNLGRSFRRWHPENNINETGEDYVDNFENVDLVGIQRLLEHRIAKREIIAQNRTALLNTSKSTDKNTEAGNVKVGTKNYNKQYNIIKNDNQKHRPSTEAMRHSTTASPVAILRVTAVKNKKKRKRKKRRKKSKRSRGKKNATLLRHKGLKTLETGDKIKISNFRASNSSKSLLLRYKNKGVVNATRRQVYVPETHLRGRDKNKYKQLNKKRIRNKMSGSVLNNRPQYGIQKIRDRNRLQFPNNRLQNRPQGGPYRPQNQQNRGHNQIGVNVAAHVSVGVGGGGYNGKQRYPTFATKARITKKMKYYDSDETSDNDMRPDNRNKYKFDSESSSDYVDYYDFQPTTKRRRRPPYTPPRRGRHTTRTWRRTKRRRWTTRRTRPTQSYEYNNYDYDTKPTKRPQRPGTLWPGGPTFHIHYNTPCRGKNCKKKCKSGKCSTTYRPFVYPESNPSTLPLEIDSQATAIPDSGDPDGGNPDIINPDGGNPDIINPDGGNPDLINPDGGNPDLINPDGGNPDFIYPDGGNPDFINPDDGNPDFINPDGGNPDLNNPDGGNPDLIDPDGGNPDPINPDGGNPDFINPDGGNPDFIDPDGGNPDFINPDGGNPDLINPDGGNPDIINPDGGNPDFINPDGGNPDFINPDGGNPDFINPDGGNPDIINPDGGNPDFINPDGGNPDFINPDGGNSDQFNPDGGNPDGGYPDGGKPNEGPPDGGNINIDINIDGYTGRTVPLDEGEPRPPNGDSELDDIEVQISKTTTEFTNRWDNSIPSFDKEDVKLTSPGDNLISTLPDGGLQPGDGLDQPDNEEIPSPDPIYNPPDNINPEGGDGEVFVPDGGGPLTEHPIDVIDLSPTTPGSGGEDMVTLPDGFTLPGGLTLPSDGKCKKCKDLPHYTLIIQNDKFKIKFEIMRNPIKKGAFAVNASKLKQNVKKDCPLAAK